MAFLEWLIHESSLGTLVNFGSRDIYLILLSRFLRMFAYGGAALVLAIYLWTSGKGGVQIGAFLTMTLLGDAIISFVLTVTSDKIGRRRVLVIGSLLMTLSGTIFTFSRNYYLLLFAAIVGVISPGAHEVGPFRAVQVCQPSSPALCKGSSNALLTRLRKQSLPNLLPSKLAQTCTPGLRSVPRSAWRVD